MHSIETSIDIGAPAETVWGIFADTAAYPAWNDVYPKLEGEWRPGGRLHLVFHPPGHGATTMPTVILDVATGSLLRFRDRLFDLPWLVQGVHEFRLEPLAGGRTRFHHTERVSGALVPLLGAMIRDSERGYVAMNEALKARAEASPGSSAPEPSGREG